VNSPTHRTPKTLEPRNSRGWIEEAYRRRKQTNPAYSLRAFARYLGVSSGRLSEICAGKRVLTEKAGQKIAFKLGLSPEEAHSFLGSIRRDRHERKSSPSLSISVESGEDTDEQSFSQLTFDAFRAISDWYHFAILSLMDTRHFKSEPRWIASRLGLSVIEVRGAIDRMKRLELIEEKNGKLVRTEAHLSTTHDVSSAALRLSHRQTLEQAIASLEEIPVELRDITSISMAIDVTRLPAAKKLIKDFRRQMSTYLEKGNKSEVYNLNIQLVPVTVPEKKENL
jgi:uncharacterized protein (TIGR02147 family)